MNELLFIFYKISLTLFHTRVQQAMNRVCIRVIKTRVKLGPSKFNKLFSSHLKNQMSASFDDAARMPQEPFGLIWMLGDLFLNWYNENCKQKFFFGVFFFFKSKKRKYSGFTRNSCFEKKTRTRNSGLKKILARLQTLALGNGLKMIGISKK